MNPEHPASRFPYGRMLDITRTLEPESAGWPGDEPFTFRWTLKRSGGSTVNLGVLGGSPHVGTHADAPLHVRDGAPAIDEVDLGAFFGPARVLDVTPGPDGLIPAEALDGVDAATPPRILLHTGTHPDARVWPKGFAALSPALATRLAEAGAVLVGIDTPSVDPESSTDLESHRILLEGGLMWLENLDLSGVVPGVYWLSALPLRIRGGDASPVRAVLFEL